MYQSTIFNDVGSVIRDTAKQYFFTGNADITQEASFLVHKNRISLNDNSILNILGTNTEKDFVEISPAPPLSFSWVK